jgi:transcriptional regulator with XRE-family HTH domain
MWMRHLRSARHRRLIEEIVRAREAAGLSQRALAARLKRSPSYISKFEAAERRLEICEFVDVCEALGVDAPDLLRRVVR